MELLVLLTHLYNDQHRYLIIDEPELNLHPQYQAFLMQEVRKIAGTPQAGTSSKGIFLITHSPFMVDLRSFDDLASVISFSADHTVPKMMHDTTEAARSKFSPMLSRLNVHHKQLFFSDNPIFVEGILDALFIEALQERRNKSITAAGSCIIDVGGKEEVTKYIELCEQFGKKAYFVFDLDSLFFGRLRSCIKDDETLVGFLARLGMGTDFGRYCGELERVLNRLIKTIEKDISASLAELKDYIRKLDIKSKPKDLAKARVAILVDIAHRREDVASVIGQNDVINAEGRLRAIVDALATKNVILLPGGTLEHYLPSYRGSRYEIDDASKVQAVDAEIQLLSTGAVDHELDTRYGDLLACISKLPASEPVDMESALKAYAGDYVHALQSLTLRYPNWQPEQLNSHLAASSDGLGRLFSMTKFERRGIGEFDAIVTVLGPGNRTLQVSEKTNAGMQGFSIEIADGAKASS